MKESNLQIKKYLFLSILTTASIAACLIIYLCIFEKSREFEKTIGKIEGIIPILNNHFYTKNASTKKFFMKYEDMLEIVKRCNNISGVIVGYSMVVECGADIVLLRNKKQFQGISRGVSTNYDRLMGLTIKEGRFFRKGDEEDEVCVIIQRLAKELDAKVSDIVKYRGKELKIIGIVAEQRPFDINIIGSNIEVYLPIKVKKQLHENEETYSKGMSIYKNSERIPFIEVYLICNPQKMELVNQKMLNLLENKYGKDKKFLLGHADTCMIGWEFVKILWTVGLLFIGSISLLINKKSLATFLLLTYSSKNQPFLANTCLLTATGGLLGVVFGGKICYYLMIEPKISSLSIFVALSISIIFGLLVAIRTVKKMRIEVKK